MEGQVPLEMSPEIVFTTNKIFVSLASTIVALYKEKFMIRVESLCNISVFDNRHKFDYIKFEMFAKTLKSIYWTLFPGLALLLFSSHTMTHSTTY